MWTVDLRDGPFRTLMRCVGELFHLAGIFFFTSTADVKRPLSGSSPLHDFFLGVGGGGGGGDVLLSQS